MYNVLLDSLPDIWVSDSGAGYPIETDFRIGIQICMIQDDPELNKQEKAEEIIKLLFINEIPDNAHDVEACIAFMLNGWFQDKESSEKEHRRLMDFDVDQWRIYAAFKQQYGIDLNEVEYLHFWKFMGMLSGLNDCVYTRVIDIRQRKFRPKMSSEERKSLEKAKEIYGLEQKRSAEEQAEDANLYDFLGGNLKFDAKELQRIEEFEKYADIDD